MATVSNIALEGGPNATMVPPGMPAELFGYAPSRWQAVQNVCSHSATMGVNATAMAALDILRSGNHPGYVVTDFRNSTLQNPQQLVIR